MKRSRLGRKTGLRSTGKRKRIAGLAELRFRLRLRERCTVALTDDGSLYRCERCERAKLSIDCHHMAGRGVAVGHKWLHDPDRNGAALCRQCHVLDLHGGTPPDRSNWIKNLAWLEKGGCLQGEEE